MSDLTDLYQELILDHCRHPRHFGKLEDATHRAEGVNPLCGDDITLYLKINSDALEKVKFIGKGCAICIASASIMSEQLQGKSTKEALVLFQLFHHLFTEDSPQKDLHTLGKAQIFANVKNYPMRVKCATLAWHTMKAALHHNSKPITTEDEE